MWTVIYIARSKKMAKKIEGLLTKEGMLVKVQAMSKKIEKEDGSFEISVPEAEVEEAQSILYEVGY